MKYACPICDSENVQYVWVDDVELHEPDFGYRLALLTLSIFFLGLPLLIPPIRDTVFLGKGTIVVHNPNKRSYYACDNCRRRIAESSILAIPDPADELERAQREEEQRQRGDEAFENARAHYFAEEALRRAGHRN